LGCNRRGHCHLWNLASRPGKRSSGGAVARV